MKTKMQTKKFRTDAVDIATEKWVARRGDRHDRTLNVFDKKTGVRIATTGHSFSTELHEHNAMPEVAHERIAAHAIAAVPEMMSALLAVLPFLDAGAMNERNEAFSLWRRVESALISAGVDTINGKVE